MDDHVESVDSIENWKKNVYMLMERTDRHYYKMLCVGERLAYEHIKHKLALTLQSIQMIRVSCVIVFAWEPTTKTHTHEKATNNNNNKSVNVEIVYVNSFYIPLKAPDSHFDRIEGEANTRWTHTYMYRVELSCTQRNRNRPKIVTPSNKQLVCEILMAIERSLARAQKKKNRTNECAQCAHRQQRIQTEE